MKKIKLFWDDCFIEPIKEGDYLFPIAIFLIYSICITGIVLLLYMIFKTN